MPSVLLRLVLDPEVIARIRSVNDAEIHRSLRDFLTKRQIDAVIARKSVYLEEVEKIAASAAK